MSTFLVELDDVLRRYAWSLLMKRSNFLRRLFMDEEDYICEVDWSYLSIEHKLAKFASKERDGQTIKTNFGDVMTGSRWTPLWSCDFDNKADHKQTHSFRGSRNTTTWVDVDVSQGYTIGQEISVDVNIPPDFSRFRAGRDNSLHLNKLKGQLFKEMLNWEVNSTVEIQPAWRAHAQLLAKQECSHMEFEIRSTLYNPSGVVPVYFKRKSDKKLVYVVELEDFSEAFKLESEGGVLTAEEKTCVEVMFQKSWDADGQVETSETFTQMVTRGSCVCLSWSDQRVDIRTVPLCPADLSADLDLETEEVVTTETKTFQLSEKQITVNCH